MRYLLLLCLLPVCTPARDLYPVHHLSERAMLQMYTAMLLDACHRAERDWKTSSFDPAAGYWGDGVSGGNEGIRTIDGMVLASATLLKYDTGLSPDDRHELLARATAGLRYITATHVTGPQKCADGKHWGATLKFGPESWQSGMWTGTLAFGAWLMWDQLNPELQMDFERVVASEDDILAARKPPNGLWLDTKAEENGWEVPPLVLGELMFSNNPHAAAWHEGAVKYMMNTLCTAADLQDTSLMEGRPVNQWVGGANLQPDFTLENHNIFHPSYVGCSSYFLTQAAMYYAYAGRPVPASATHHLMDAWRMFQTVLLPWGESAYPQGMDWELHGLPFLNLFATLATRDHDRFAARMEQQSLQYLRAWQLMGRGDLALPGSRFGITRHSINAEQAAYGFMAHVVFGPAAAELSSREAVAREKGVWQYPYVDFIIHRTMKKFVSFSWKNRIMGQIIPIEPGHEGSPEFTVPVPGGFVGSFDLTPAGDVKTKVLAHSWKKTPGGFETAGTLLLNGGRLKQNITVMSAGEQTLVYQDRVTAVTDVTVAKARGLCFGIENDEISGGVRLVSSADGTKKFDWKTPRRQPAELLGSWADVDGRLGLVVVAGSGMAYAQAAGYTPGICVCADQLYGSYTARPQNFRAGEEVAHRIGIVFAGAAPKETAAAARSCHIESSPSGPVLYFKPPEGKPIEVPLLQR